VIWCAVVPQGGGAGGSIDSTVRRDEGRAEEQGVGLVGSWLVMHKHQYRPGYSGRARNRDRGGMIRCAVVPQVGGAEVAQCGTVAPLDTQRKAQRRANTGQQWTPHQPQGVFQQLPRPQGAGSSNAAPLPPGPPRGPLSRTRPGADLRSRGRSTKFAWLLPAAPADGPANAAMVVSFF
jgi:hypothetical protein